MTTVAGDNQKGPLPQRRVGRARSVEPNLRDRLRAAAALPRDILIARLVYACRRPLFALPGSLPNLSNGGPAMPLATPPDPWPGDALAGSGIVAGRFLLAGQSLEDPQPLWAPRGTRSDWRAELHSFYWLRHLRAAGGDAARRRARDLVGAWLDTQRRWSYPAWDPLVIARRLSHWLGQWDFYAASAEITFRRRLLSAVSEQAAHLARVLPAGLSGADLICALKGLAIAGACLPDAGSWLKRALAMLEAELPRQLLPDGGHLERSPARHLAVLRDLIDIKSTLHAAEQPIPEGLQTAIESMAPMLRLYQHGDGGLALFNGSSAEEDLKIEMVLQRADAPRRPRLSAPQTGFQRVQAGRTLLLVDAGPPPPCGYDERAHAGTLSFELSVGRERLIVNCGAPAPEGGSENWRQALRATAAHSTVIVQETNSSPLSATPGRWCPGMIARPDAVHCRREEIDGSTLLETSHDGYRRNYGAVHHRRLFLLSGGDELRGEDRIEIVDPERAPSALAYAVRFHLHPGVTTSLVRQGTEVLLRLPRGGGWRLTCEGSDPSIEESIYLGDGQPRRSQQIVLRASVSDGEGLVLWTFTREGGKRS